MRGSTIVMLALALVSGTGAVFASHFWINARADSRLQEINASNIRPDVATIVVAAAGLRFGTVLKSGNLREIPWPTDALPTGAYNSITNLLADGRRVVLTPIEENEPLLSTKITGAGQRASLSSIITEGMGAVTIRVNDVVGVAGFVLPGDRVDILLTRKSEEGVGSNHIILRGARVLAVDQTADERKNSPTVVKAVTLEVNTYDAQKVALAGSIGTLSLMLRQAGNLQRLESRRVTMSDLMAGTSSSSEADKPTKPISANQPRSMATIYVSAVGGRSEHLVPRE